jgi:hypothetical protein
MEPCRQVAEECTVVTRWDLVISSSALLWPSSNYPQYHLEHFNSEALNDLNQMRCAGSRGMCYWWVFRANILPFFLSADDVIFSHSSPCMSSVDMQAADVTSANSRLYHHADAQGNQKKKKKLCVKVMPWHLAPTMSVGVDLSAICFMYLMLFILPWV